MVFTGILIIIAFVYVVFNIIIAMMMSAEDMMHKFIYGQCIVGAICANIFYAPAWFLKAIRFVVVSAIK